MKLNIPILEELKDKQNILIIGIGGGFDVYCGLPIMYELLKLNKNIILANYSFTNFMESTIKTDSININPNLIENKSSIKIPHYNPEIYLKEGLKNIYDIDQTIYSIKREGYKTTLKQMEFIVNKHDIDCIIAIDGGVDSIFHGDEEGCGTILEDSITLSCLREIKLDKYLVCIGLGTEIEEKLCNYTAFEIISEKFKDESILGTCSLTKSMESFHFFKTLCEYCWNIPNHKKSHISSRIIPAVEGDFGGDVFYNFLMGLYFFFKLDNVVEKNTLIEQLKLTTNFGECMLIAKNRKINIKSRKLEL